MKKYRIIHIESGEFIDIKITTMERTDSILFSVIRRKACSLYDNSKCSITPCNKCPWDGWHGRLEYDIQEIL